MNRYPIVYQLDGCWVWTGRKDWEGYGRTGGKLAHRVVYEDTQGVDLGVWTLDHTCGNKSCVNPAHMDVVSRRENIRREYQRRE